MDSRERTLLAIEHQEPDRVPLDCWLSSGTQQKIKLQMGKSFNDFLDYYDVDLRYIDGPVYIGPELKAGSNVETDIWGVPRRPIILSLNDSTGVWSETYKEVSESPLQKCSTVEEINEYARWPSADWFDYSSIEKQCDEVRDKGRVVVFMGDRLNRFAQLKPAMYLRGVEQILMDMAMDPDMARSIFGKIEEFYLDYGNRLLEASKGKIDIVCTGDDFGSQQNMLISPQMWKSLLGKGFSHYIELGKAYGARVMHHTCGSVHNIIEEMIEYGLDILQSIQPEALNMDPGVLKNEFGGRISFQGGISIQKVLPFGKPEDVEKHVKYVFEKMMPGGGYIACTAHNIQADTTIDNIKALFGAYHKYGSYVSN
jgi:uroporphyrinogen decarboxylase